MRTTLAVDDELVARAAVADWTSEKSALVLDILSRTIKEL